VEGIASSPVRLVRGATLGRDEAARQGAGEESGFEGEGKKVNGRRAAAFVFFWANGVIVLAALSVVLSGCLVGQLTPAHVITTKPDGTVVDDECVTDTQIVIRSARIECQENRILVIEECAVPGICTYTREGRVLAAMQTSESRVVFFEFIRIRLRGERRAHRSQMRSRMERHNVY
jgi:hypothetical protein